jgi:integrase/recombinase XerD
MTRERTDEREQRIREMKKHLTEGRGSNLAVDPEEFDVQSKWARRYLAYRRTPDLKNKTLAESSIKQYESNLREWVNFLTNSNLTVLEAEFDDLIEYVLYCIELGRRTSTIMQRVSVIKNFYKYLATNEEITPQISPLRCDEIQTSEIDDLTPNELERDALSKGKVQQLFDAMDRNRDRLMTITAVETGFRNSDIRGIRLMDVDLDEPEIKAHNPKYGDPYTVPISEELALELDIWINNGRVALVGANDSDYLFPSTDGGMVESNDQLGKIIREAAEEAGIQSILGKTEYDTKYMKTDQVKKTWYEVVPHTLRHTFVTLLENKGVPLEYRRLLAGHESAETTQRYSHGKKKILKEAQDQINLNI